MSTGMDEAPPSIKLYDPSKLVTIIINTSLIPSCPSAKIIHAAVTSLMTKQPELLGCRMLIMCDGPPHPPTQTERARWRGYIANLKILVKKDPAFKHGEVIRRKWGGLPGAIIEAFKLVKTPLILNYQHDWHLVGTVNLQAIVRTLMERPEVQLIRLYKKPISQGGQYLWKLVPVEGYDIPLIKISAWSDNPHFATTKHYRKFVLPYIVPNPRRPGRHGVEGKIHRRYQARIKEVGFDKAHAELGPYFYGRIGEGPFVRHLDGREQPPRQKG